MADVRPKKHLGQHFLTEPVIAENIAAALSGQFPAVLEIGPGKGILTKALLADPGIDLKVVEIDRESVTYLNENFPELEGRIISADFLKMDLSGIFEGKYCIAGNFPYNISSQILFRIFYEKDRIPEMVGMFQKEVARRIVSPPGSKVYGILSVLLQTWYDIEYLFTVEPGSFFPVPKVQSGVIRMRRNARARLEVDEKLFFRLVKAGFNQRRKTLRNSLHDYQFEGNEKELLLLKMRAEQLGVEDWILLCRMVSG